MTKLRFNPSQLADELKNLQTLSRVAFAESCAERLHRAYDEYASKTGRVDARALKESRNRLWEALASGSAIDSNQEIALCSELVPDMDDKPWSKFQAEAEDAATAHIYALRCYESGDIDEAIRAAERSYSALDNFVLDREDIDVNSTDGKARLAEHPLIQKELARQRRDLDDLSNGSATITELRERATNEAREVWGGFD